MKHLMKQEAALAASGDLPLFAKLKSQAHCLVCADCRANVAQYREDSLRVQAIVPDFELPRAMNWNEIEQEMFANIRLGLDVSEIGQSLAQDPQPHFSWRAAVAGLALSATVMTGWFLAGPGGSQPYLRHIPQAFAQVKQGALTLRGDEHGVGVLNSGSGMFLRNISSPSHRLQVGLEGSLRASSVDSESGQVSVSQIYVE